MVLDRIVAKPFSKCTYFHWNNLFVQKDKDDSFKKTLFKGIKPG